MFPKVAKSRKKSQKVAEKNIIYIVTDLRKQKNNVYNIYHNKKR